MRLSIPACIVTADKGSQEIPWAKETFTEKNQYVYIDKEWQVLYTLPEMSETFIFRCAFD